MWQTPSLTRASPARPRSAGKKQSFEGVEYTIQELTKNRRAAQLCSAMPPRRPYPPRSRPVPLTLCPRARRSRSFAGIDIALFSAGGDISRDFAPAANAAGATVVDNSSAFRMTQGVPLVVPEVNPDAMKGMKAGKGGIIANPNCSTIIALMAVTPLHRVAKVTRMVVSTYQAASGAGAAAMAVRGARLLACLVDASSGSHMLLCLNRSWSSRRARCLRASR
jgi:aspartate-semialdehyde dehydrogenase